MTIYKDIREFENDKEHLVRLNFCEMLDELYYGLHYNSGVVEKTNNRLHCLCEVFEEFLESSEEGRKFLKDFLSKKFSNVKYIQDC